jgi:hypothetical protein
MAATRCQPGAVRATSTGVTHRAGVRCCGTTKMKPDIVDVLTATGAARI